MIGQEEEKIGRSSGPIVEFDPHVWNLEDRLFSPFGESPEAIAHLFRNLTRAQREIACGILNHVCTRVADFIQQDTGSWGKYWFDYVSKHHVISVVDKHDHMDASWNSPRELNVEEKVALDALQEALGAKLVGEEPETGRREFTTTVPGVRILSFQNDGTGKNIYRIGAIRLILGNPQSMEIDPPIPPAILNPDNDKLSSPSFTGKS